LVREAKSSPYFNNVDHKKQDRQMRQVHLLSGITDRKTAPTLQIARWSVRIDSAGSPNAKTTRSDGRVRENIVLRD